MRTKPRGSVLDGASRCGGDGSLVFVEVAAPTDEQWHSSTATPTSRERLRSRLSALGCCARRGLQLVKIDALRLGAQPHRFGLERSTHRAPEPAVPAPRAPPAAQQREAASGGGEQQLRLPARLSLPRHLRGRQLSVVAHAFMAHAARALAGATDRVADLSWQLPSRATHTVREPTHGTLKSPDRPQAETHLMPDTWLHDKRDKMIWAKTDTGRAALISGAGLDSRIHRCALLAIDGRTEQAALITSLTSSVQGISEAAFQTLFAGGRSPTATVS